MNKFNLMKTMLVAGSMLALLAVASAQTSNTTHQATAKPLNASDSTKKMDVLFIAIDDMNDWTTLFDKNNPIQTPNLERLAQRGCFFTRAYCASPGCNPSRTAIMTGLRPTTSGVYSNKDPWRKILPNAVTLPQYFEKHGGYATRGAGKIYHHGGTGREDPNNPSFQAFFKKLPIRGPGRGNNYNGYKPDKNGRLGNPGFDWGEHDQKMIDVDMCEWVEARMDEPRDKPLFLAAGIFNPHLPFYAPKETFTRYPLEKTVMPPMPEGDLDDVGEIAKRMARKEFFVWENTTAAEPGSVGSLKRMVQCYQAASDFADEMVGRLLDKLDETGRADNTIIVLWSDHGYHLGDKECCVKFTLWEKANRVPFIIVAPGVAKPGSRCDRPVGLIDIYPTLLELAGLPPKADNDGISLVPLLKDPGRTWERPALMTEGPGNHAIRSDRWRYIRYSDGVEELYKDNDPWNHTNLAANAEYSEILAQHRAHLPKTEAPGIPAPHQTLDDNAWKQPNKERKVAAKDMQTFESYRDTDYNQKHRPQFHFTSRKNWLNDPNGLVYYDGEYHLFFQHNPKGNKGGNKTWGHAVSKDMVHWEQLPHAILPYGGGTIFSGTGAVDQNNTLGKQKGDVKTLLACFTLARKGPFYQALAYSTDKGRTFELFNEGKAVVPNQGINRSERDPKIFWHEQSEKWVMILWVKKAVTAKDKRSKNKRFKNKPIGPGKVRFFTSDNLTDWTVASDFDRDWVYECMDFVHLPVDGDPNNKKWLLFDASFDYEIGEFDGTTFTTDKKVGLGDFGRNYYAAQTFNNSPDGRTVVIGWMRKSDFDKVGMPFNQQMSFPTTMELRTTPDGVKLFRWPIKEIESLYTKKHEFMNRPVEELAAALSVIDADLIDASIEFDPKETGDLEWNLRGLKVRYQADEQQFFYDGVPLVAPPVNGKVKLRVLVDRGSIELFANDGSAVATHFALPDPENRSVSLSGNGNVSLVINELKSSWPHERPDVGDGK